LPRLVRYLAVAWAAPTTALGLLAGGLALATGGRARWRRPVVEFHGGFVSWFLARMPNQPIAMTLGHTVLGATAAALDITRDHELVHVRQCERWGPLFLPAYLACSLVLWVARRDPYYDNPFEREAYRHDGRDTTA